MTLLLTYRQDGEKGPTMESKLYLAYGSNLNLRQMAHRCPGAELLGYTYLENTRLILPLYAMDGTLRPGSIDAMAYRLPCSSPAGLPIPYYIRICREGYLDFGFDPAYLDQALTATKEEMCK